MQAPELAFGLRWERLGDTAELRRLDQAFLDWLHRHDPECLTRLLALRAQPPAQTPERSVTGGKAEIGLADDLIRIARALDGFVAALFRIEEAVGRLRARASTTDALLRVKYKFVKRQALLGVDEEARASLDPDALRARLRTLGADPDAESVFADAVLAWQEQARSADPHDKALARDALGIARDYAAWAAGTPHGRLRHGQGIVFRHPQPLDAQRRIEWLRPEPAPDRSLPVQAIAVEARHRRTGFALTDHGADTARAIDEAKYCLLCHRQGNDSCSRGLASRAEPRDGEAAGSPEGMHAGTGHQRPRFARSPFGEPLGGCPLGERISEFHQLKLDGHTIGALAMIVLDNPMVAATGHRICNDCMKSCVFQNQTPVDTPRAETRVLRDVLELPWGVEIYALLVRWNPLHLHAPLPAEPTGRRVLVVGAGPAGFTLAHHLLRRGHGVVLIDGLKIEPGFDARQPVRDLALLEEPLDARIAAGFGGVAEYGITARWDKNLLAVVRLLLERESRLRLLGGVYFGGNLGTEDAWRMGFDHVALATGAGAPTLIDMPGALAPGVRTASDFLMALQLTGAARSESLANFQLRLPVVVIGGGLTATDCATEALAYYPVQVEKFLARHERLVAERGEAAVRADWSAREGAIAEEFLRHARALREERERAAAAGTAPDEVGLLRAWGGVTIAYRRDITRSPAYQLNPEELAHALDEGVDHAGEVRPVAVRTDAHGDCAALEVERGSFDARGAWQARSVHALPARTVFMAAGTRPNTVIATEEPGRYRLDGAWFAAVGAAGEPVPPNAGPKPPQADFFCVREPDGRMVSFLGDAHPAFAGSVVRAMASAKRCAPAIDAALARLPARAEPSRPADANDPAVSRATTAGTPPGPLDFEPWAAGVVDALSARVDSVVELAPGIVEVVLRAPSAARRFRPGQFFRLQNYERLAPVAGTGTARTRLGMEALAMTGAWVDVEAGLVGTIVLETGASTDLCRELRAGEPVVLMGPTGMPSEIVAGRTVVLVGGGLGNAVLFSIGRAMRARGSRVLYFAAYRKPGDRFRPEDIEAAADAVVWCCDTGGLAARRPQDAAFHGNVVDALIAHAQRRLDCGIANGLAEADHLLAIGSDGMMAAVAAALAGPLATSLKPGFDAIASVNSPMQCMMKAICGQCLQRQVDPVDGRVRYVFSCSAQDQPMVSVDFASLAGRLAQNRLQEVQARRWLSLVRTEVARTPDTIPLNMAN